MAIARDLSGTVLAGRYRVLDQIGGGGMGTVHAGEHIEVGRKVAIKILLPDALQRPTMVERFRREARVTARIEHEHVVECLDVGVTPDNLCFYVMEWLRGEDLHALLRRERTLAWPRARAIVTQVCRAVAAAHEKGVIHRDLKPGNIFLIRREDNPDFVKVLDFGIAKLVAPDEGAEALTRAGEVLGTTPYMAPELAAGEPFDHRIDVYATGVILFQALCGRLPFRGRTPRQIMTEILVGDIPRLGERNPQIVVSPALDAVLRRAMHRDLQQRFPDMAALHEALMELPDDACRPAEPRRDAPDPSASESAMEISVFGPMQAGGDGPATGELPTLIEGPRPPEQQPTMPEVPRPVAERRRGGLLALVGGVALLAGAAAFSVWTWGAPPLASMFAQASGDGATSVEVVAQPRAEADDLGGESARGAAEDGSPVTPTEPTEAKKPLSDPTPNEAKPTEPTAEDPSVPTPGTDVAKPTDPIVAETSEQAVATPDSEAKASKPGTEQAEPPTTDEAKAKARSESRTDFTDVMRKASPKVRRCLAQGGLQSGTRVRFDIVVEAKTGRITAATPRAPHDRQAALGGCVVDAARGTTVRPAPANEWRRSHEFTS